MTQAACLDGAATCIRGTGTVMPIIGPFEVLVLLVLIALDVVVLAPTRRRRGSSSAIPGPATSDGAHSAAACRSGH
ncbi:hypothetical protein DVA67_025590 [Solirubrobacter sp. CPCC 204708]|nr:hypothetical protein [Solirubrobacter deserti]